MRAGGVRRAVPAASLAHGDEFGGIAGPPRPASSNALRESAIMPVINIKAVLPIVMLSISNVFMTFAWYGHLKYKSAPLVWAVAVSWLIASFEYMFQVPANRMGSAVYTTAQLKTIQEVITLTVFCGFSVTYLGENLRWNYLVGFAFMVLAAFFIFKKW